MAILFLEPGVLLHVDAAEALDAMRQAAVADGVDEASQRVPLDGSAGFDSDVASERNQTAEERARVGSRLFEHSTGYAVDLGDGEFLKPTSPSALRTPEPSAGSRSCCALSLCALFPGWQSSGGELRTLALAFRRHGRCPPTV